MGPVFAHARESDAQKQPRADKTRRVQVVQCLTELGLSFTKARVTSDGGWFVDGAPRSRTDPPVPAAA